MQKKQPQKLDGDNWTMVPQSLDKQVKVVEKDAKADCVIPQKPVQYSDSSKFARLACVGEIAVILTSDSQ